MSESDVNRVSRPPSSRHRSASDSPRHNKASKRFRRSSSTSSASNYDDNDEYDQQQGKDGEVLSKPTPIPSSRPSGLYMPPAKLRILQASLTDKSSAEYQRLAWEALEKTINERVNNLNTSNLPLISRELFTDNFVRGRGLLARDIIQAQTASPLNTSVYAGLVSVINTKFPPIGELILKRLISSFRRQYQENDKMNCIAITRFIAHLVNQNVVWIMRIEF
jgi:pre-mRNA-splicing factor CWC22